MIRLDRYYGNSLKVTLNVISGSGKLYISSFNSHPNEKDNDMVVEYYEKDNTSLDSNRIWFDYELPKRKKGFYMSF